jgi:hypothetical protein
MPAAEWFEFSSFSPSAGITLKSAPPVQQQQQMQSRTEDKKKG